MHRDLAARNVFLTEDLRCKVGVHHQYEHTTLSTVMVMMRSHNWGCLFFRLVILEWPEI